MKSVTIGVLIAILAAPFEGRAQGPAEQVDPTKLGVSLDRIRRELRQAEVKEQAGDGPLKLEFLVEVYGTAPTINFLENFPLNGPSMYGGPTHREVLEFLTPIQYRTPVVPVSAIVGWAVQQMWMKSRKSRCEAELAEYKQLVMQGVAVAAPRCTQ